MKTDAIKINEDYLSLDDIVDSDLLEELSFLEGLNQDDMNDVVDYSRLDNTDLESENLLFSINKVTVNSIHQSVDAAVILFNYS